MKYTILVADDSKLYFNTIEEAFRQLGDNYRLLWASTGKMACLLAERHLPDLILMDVIMPEMNGVQAIKKLKENPLTSDIPVIMLSATESLKAAYETGAHDFISKPFKHFELLMRVKASLTLIDKIKEIKKQKEKLENEHQKVSQQRKEMIDDITYSKRIQRAILPTNDMVRGIFPEHFILNIPRNIVSGDFYWVGQKSGKKIILVADCTGHGISGAFMTMAGIAYMNEIFNRYSIEEPAEYLYLLREQVMKLLHQKGLEGEASDGMDVALCIVDEKNKTLKYAGANNPLYYVNQNGLEVYKADRMPIGIHVNFTMPFTSHTILYTPGDMLYLFSDGYADQFGGPDNKKFRYKQFQELLASVHNASLAEQNETLLRTFLHWKGDEEQIDDILIIGVRLS
ncbi:MAG: SpoIIE family protein phosphatase [Bacteroidales bacterium]|nr:SpoIIE family protein phosphatase [Bacteroidales bacterium]MBN2762091.1 SpoIIE family protein phosphatase [Bacteroidales bacterium]